MSARKPLARMDSPATIESIDEILPATGGVTVEAVSKTVPTENGGKLDAITIQSDVKEHIQIKEENQDPEEAGSAESQKDSLPPVATVTSTEAKKRMTRNSPMLIASPLKKKLSDSQEQDSSAESTSTTDEAPKRNEKLTAARLRKQSDTSSKSSSSTVPPTNRLTRKAAAQDWAANTRLTRARRTSAGIGARPGTPQKRKYVFKKNIDPPAPAAKRKRSVSPKPSAEERDAKISKTDDQDADFDMNAITVKQEILESSEEMASDVASDITDPFAAEPTSRISLRARKAAMSYSPSTRQYRRDKDKDKLNAEATALDGKRKRLSRLRPDEDSKDSMASSTIEDLVDVKVEEKFQPEDANEPAFTQPITANPCTPAIAAVDTVANGTIVTSLLVESTESIDLPLEVVNIESINLPFTIDTTESIDLPLTVDTTESIPEPQTPSTSAAAVVSEQSTSLDKDASLSPELVSEGVSEISVKQFYKKPEFLENNLGIEKDPKLGEIVQNVSEKMDDTVDATSISNESMKEGELVFMEDDDEATSIGSIRNDNIDEDDVNSVSTGFISPLLVEEDEEEEEDEEMQSTLNSDEKTEEPLHLVELQLFEEKKELEIEKEELAAEVLSGNGSVGEIVESKGDDVSKEGVKSESCDTTVVGDIEQIIGSKKEKLSKAIEEPTSVEESIYEEKKEEIVKKPIELMEVDELKIEESKVEEAKIEKLITDHEENKENLDLGAESVKEDVLEVAVTPEKESASSMSSDNQDESPSESSKTTSPAKTQGESSGEATTPSTSPQSSKSSSVPRTPENDERLRQKERHLKTLGLLTHKAADEAIMAKQKRRKFLHNLSNNSSSKKNANTNAATNSGGSAAGNAQNKSSQEYTGTLKTVIKLNRQSGGGAGGGGANEPKKGKSVETATKTGTSGCGNRRQSLKMTFQKGRGRPANTEKSGENPANTSGEDSYYTIQNEGDGTTTSTAPVTGEPTSTVTTATTSHGRKSYNRSNTTDATHHPEHNEAPASSKKDEKEEILIPEKASSFKFHPGRLCQDQCYYCSGKFGLYDTPCHVGQIKSVERQQKILANEEKLTVDNCLCDACFRHVDRRANVPSYKKRLSAPGHIETVTTNPTTDDTPSEQEKSQQKSQQQSHANGSAASSSHTCAVPDCNQMAAHSLRRKGIRKSIKKSLLNFDMSTAGTYLHICEKHYEAVVQSSGCVLCKRRLGKNNMYHITTDTDRLEKALAAMGIPVTLGQGTAVCKLCRYFANLLMKPPEHGKVQKVEFVKNYRKRLLHFYNIHDKKDTSHEEDDEDKDKEKPSSKKQNSATSSKRATRKSRTSNETEEESKEPMESPPSPAHSTGSSVEMISDGGIFNAEETPQRTATTTAAGTAAVAATAASNQMVLDNDVMVDYDVPMSLDSSSSTSSKSTSPSPQRIKKAKDQQSKLKTILQSVGTSLEDRNDISTVLRSNPNISMRELFPGEEDLGLQFKAPFGSSSSQRTPEGWTRINTFLQYDEPTRRLWEDLQKPYGNQSSFLRHLILLEKYYRNGDLILSSNASSNATVYSQTVSNRLTSFDSRSSSSSTSSKEMERRSRSLSVDKIQRQLSSNSVTITARPKEPKPQQKESEAPKQKDGGSSAGAAASSTPNSRSILKTNLIGTKGGAVEIVPLSASNSTSNSPHSSSGSTTPNDNSLTKQQKILAAANKLMNNKLEASPNHKKTLSTTPPELISLNRRPVPPLNSQPMKRPQLLPKPMNSAKPIPPNVIVLPDTLTVQERIESKSWRPTLLPVTTSSHHLNNQQGPLYQTADGRRLPALVQVQSGGRPFLISIHDYNRMCILRREKLMRDQMLKGSKGKVKGQIFPPATCIPNNTSRTATTTNAALQSFNKTMQSVTVTENAAKKQRVIMSKPGNFTPIAPKPIQTITGTTSAPSTCTSQQQHSQSQPTVILPAGTLQPIGLLSSTQPSGLSILPNFTGHVLPILNPNTSTASTATISGVPTNSWLWNNFPDISDNQMMMNGKSTATKGPPQATFTSMKQQSLLLDNNLMSKIPKSLTVIPQHKLMPAPSSVSGNMSKD